MDSATNDATSFIDGFECLRDEGSDRSENNSCIKRFRSRFIRSAYPGRSKAFCKLIIACFSGARERIDFPSLVPGNLGHKVRRRAKTINTQLSNATKATSHDKRPISNQPGTKKRGGDCWVRVGLRNRKTKAFISNDVLSVTAVTSVAGKLRSFAKIFFAPFAEAALAAGPT